WSLGVTLYCALAGHTPHEHIAVVHRIIMAICTSPVRPLRQCAPGVRPEVEEVVHRALAINPAERYPSAAAMMEANALREAAGLQLPAVPSEDHAPKRGPRPRQDGVKGAQHADRHSKRRNTRQSDS